MNAKPDYDRIFNEGCQARLEGQRLTENPYLTSNQCISLANQWVRGWQDVDRHWGADVKGPVPKLKRVY